MPRPDISGDASAAFDVLKKGGVAILPMDVGYSLIGGSATALNTIFDTKGRGKNKLNAMLADTDLQREIHILDSRGDEILNALTVDYDLPLGAIAPARLDHPILQKMTQTALAGSSKTGTVLMLVNAGSLHREICRLSRQQIHPLFGSSANLSLTGTKFRVDDIEPEIMAIADIVIDHGLRKYHLYRASSTLLNLKTLEVVRFGSCYELICDVLRRHFSIELPPPPDGHLTDLVGDRLVGEVDHAT
jgi:tRNA A37 threonylcarbamoyladenosine synthetase subunit TsaC/SUA5/YrdC